MIGESLVRASQTERKEDQSMSTRGSLRATVEEGRLIVNQLSANSFPLIASE